MMSIAAEYERETWERQGGWRGVEPYVDVVTLLFRDDDEIDDLEESGETRAETVIEERGVVLVKVTRHRAFRTYERMDDGVWVLIDEGERDFTDSVIVPGTFL